MFIALPVYSSEIRTPFIYRIGFSPLTAARQIAAAGSPGDGVRHIVHIVSGHRRSCSSLSSCRFRRLFLPSHRRYETNSHLFFRSNELLVSRRLKYTHALSKFPYRRPPHHKVRRTFRDIDASRDNRARVYACVCVCVCKTTLCLVVYVIRSTAVFCARSVNWFSNGNRWTTGSATALVY